MQNIYAELIALLEVNPAYIVFDDISGKSLLNKGLIIDHAFRLKPELLKLLLSNKSLKKQFFTDAGGVVVFDKIAFQRFVNTKKFLADSYTQYKNKIGLSIDGDKYLSDKRDVVLVWPYKDCVLEGGQTKEDARRDEVFYNTILAPDEIDVLTAPKVLTNWRRYDIKGEMPLGTIAKNDNLIIKGNNLLSLHTLKERYRGQVKLIYIDPPYNTGGAANTFAYNNTFNHSSWLTFMANRLKIAKELLKSNGCICIAIDDAEYAHLKVLCDEIFDRENYLGTIVVQSNPRGRTINSHFATCHEYALVYARNASFAVVNNLALTNKQEENFDKQDIDGKFRFLPFRRSGGTSTPAERPNSEFAIYYSTGLKKIIAVGGERIGDATKKYEPKVILTLNPLNDTIIENNPKDFIKGENNLIEILPIDTSGKRRVWRWSDRLAILKAAKNDDFNIIEDGSTFTIQLKDRIKEGRKPKTIWSDSKYDASASGTMLLKKMFSGDKVFSYPKSLYAVRDIIEILTELDEDDIVLDFFGGSGTTAHAVLDLNKEDEGNRRFIICEQMDYIETVTRERVKKVIESNKEGSFVYVELMKSNQHFIDEIQKANTDEDLLLICVQMQKIAFLSYKVKPNQINETVKEFEALSFVDKQHFLIDTLDKNLLYVNYRDMDSEEYDVSDYDKAMNQKFYSM
jgi:adenine-specific DNA-methyltransferase